MNIISLNPKARFNSTGGNILEGITLETFNELSSTPVMLITDESLKIKDTKLDKLLSYWKNWKEIAKADIILTNISNRRLCFFLNFIKRKNPKCTIVVTHHHFAFMTYDKPSIKKTITKFYEMNILKAADVIAVSGQYPYEITLKYFDKDKVVHTGVPIDKKKHTLSCKEQGELLYIGTIEPRKGIDYLIKALGDVKEQYHLNMAGSYSKHIDYYNELIITAKENGTFDKIDFLGRVSEEEKEKLLQKAYSFVFPTLNEGYGIVMLEAMGHGIPVIAFNNSSIPYIVNDNVTGLIVENRNTKDLSKKISYLLKSPGEANRMGKNALEAYENAEDREGFKKKIREVYELAIRIRESRE